MSKYSEFMEDQYRNIGKIRDATRTLIREGRDIAFKEFHDANSVAKLKEKIERGF